jgi:hypothetical protein
MQLKHKTPYHWSRQDKIVYMFVMLPFIAAFAGVIVLLANISLVLSVVFVALYLLGNVFQAACCVGCPYQGRFCPAAFGCYPANWLSTRRYAGRKHDPAFFERNATRGELSVISALVLACVGLATINGWYVVILLALVGMHFGLLLILFCPKCGYAGTCPAGQMACRLFKRQAG